MSIVQQECYHNDIITYETEFPIIISFFKNLQNNVNFKVVCLFSMKMILVQEIILNIYIINVHLRLHIKLHTVNRQ